MNNPFRNSREKIICEHCTYNIVKPYPEDYLCPKCHKFSANIFEVLNNSRNQHTNIEPRQFEPRQQTASSTVSGVRVREEHSGAMTAEDYINFFGITSKEKTPLYSSNEEYSDFLELTNNLDNIATSILGGILNKMELVSENNRIEKCLFYERNNIIYILIGDFSDKKGTFILQNMALTYEGLVRDKDINNLELVEKSEIDMKFRGFLNYIRIYLDTHNPLTNREIPCLDNWIQVDYVGLSAKTTGVISLLLDDENKLNIKGPAEPNNQVIEIEMKEDILTAKIEAIATYVQGMTVAYPRWIAVKIGYQKYRFLTFKKYPNDFLLSCLSEGNLEKIEKVELCLDPLLLNYVKVLFNGDLKSFNELKAILKNLFKKIPERKFY